MPLRFKKRLLAHMKHGSYRPVDIDALAEDLGIDPEEWEEFGNAVWELSQDNQVVYGNDKVVRLPPIGSTLLGSFRRNQKGFGFIIPDNINEHGDLFVPAHDTLDAQTGDRVRADVIRRRGKQRPGDDRSPFVGKVTEILERKQTTFSGTLIQHGGQWLIEPDGKNLRDAVVVRDPGAKNAHEGDKVTFQILRYPEGYELGEGVITKVLGEAGLPKVETQAVIEAYDLPGEFPEAVMGEAVDINKRFEKEIEEMLEAGLDPHERLDLRDTFICTIDPPDAKDFDDALSIERVDNVPGGGPGWRLGVHIADVSTFVTPGSALDTEGADRGNSCYLPRLVIPMLPEVLSNGICSLQEGVPRFCKTAFIEYDEKGAVRGTGFASTLIQSAKRMTYLEAQALIDGDQEEAKKHARTDTAYTPQLLEALQMMNTLSRRIRERRKKQGMIHLDLPDVELVFDKDGRVTDAVPEDNAYTHTLIEMFMVEANEATARLFEDMGVPVMRRVHPEPVPGAMDTLRDFVKVAGYRIPKSPSREELQGLLEATAGTPAAPAVHFAVLRTLTKAEYSPALVGHFALASSAYSHFTSPIRRYPDLTTHRALSQYLSLTKNGHDRPRSDQEKTKLGKALKEVDGFLDEQALVQIGSRCNATEDRAEGAERELRQFLVLQLLEGHIGGTFPGLVTGVSNAGIFVQLEKYLAEGMVKSADLPSGSDDPRKTAMWRLDQKTGALVEKNSGRSFNVGDRVKVTIAEIDLARRQMELVIADAKSRNVGKAKRPAGGLNIGGDGGGTGEAEGAGFGGQQRTGKQKRAQRSKSRDKRKSDHRSDKKDKGKRQ